MKGRGLHLLLALLFAGCSAQEKLVGPFGPPQIPETGVSRAAFLAEVNLAARRVTITPPRIATAGASLERADRPDFSLVGGDAVMLTTSNFAASAVGAFQPGKVRVSFDVAITNRLAGAELGGPTTFPSPPPGTTGPLLFPYDIAVATTSGGVSGGGQGGDVIVILPGGGLVAPSSDWDGAPFNFFNDSGCGGNDCYRWEEFAPIPPGTTTNVGRVGFDLDPTVGQFTARLILAADLIDTSLPQPGTVQGTVTSPAIGPIAGAVVTATPGGLSAVTSASGSFTLAGLAPGTVSLDVSGIPSICAPPGASPVLVAAGTVTTVTVPVSCTPPPLLGSLTGSVRLPSGPGLGGLGVVVTPTGGTPLPSVLTDTSGAFALANLPVSDGTGTLVLTGLPTACTDPGPVPYQGLTAGGSAAVSVTVDCVVGTGGYPLSASFTGGGGSVTLRLSVDLSPYNDLLVNGVAPDDIQSIQGSIGYDATRLQLTGCAAVPGSQMNHLTVNSSVPGMLQFLNFTTASGPVVGLQEIMDCSFVDLGGSAVSTLTTITLARSFDGHDLLPHLIVTEAALP